MTQNEGRTLLLKAHEFADLAHAGQHRKSGEDFINHCIRIKNLLEDVGIKDPITLSAALLHAVVSHGTATQEEVEKEFGEEIAYLVEILTDIARNPIPLENENKRVENLHKLFIQLSKDIRVLIIRLADRVDNIQTCDSLKLESRKWISQKALTIYSPIAKAVGIYMYNRLLMDECLRITNPDRYKKIFRYRKIEFQNVEKQLEKVKYDISRYLSEKNIKHEISYRKKGIYSTHEKAINKAKKGDIRNANDFAGLHDMIGLRVIVEDIPDCYIVLAYLQENFPTINEEFDDYIRKPKGNGYRSLQIPVKINNKHICEVQIRTFEMHDLNEYGAASHFVYKYGELNSEKSIGWIKELIEMKDQINESLAKTPAIKIFEDTIFVFTPKESLITLPKGSTPVDFAYAIHTDLGKTCCGAKINGKLVKLDAELKSGQTIEIMTDRNHRPSPHWLEFAKSKCARDEITKSIRL